MIVNEPIGRQSHQPPQSVRFAQTAPLFDGPDIAGSFNRNLKRVGRDFNKGVRAAAPGLGLTLGAIFGGPMGATMGYQAGTYALRDDQRKHWGLDLPFDPPDSGDAPLPMLGNPYGWPITPHGYLPSFAPGQARHYVAPHNAPTPQRTKAIPKEAVAAAGVGLGALLLLI